MKIFPRCLGGPAVLDRGQQRGSASQVAARGRVGAHKGGRGSFYFFMRDANLGEPCTNVKRISFWQNHPPNCGLYESSTLSFSPLYDKWVRHEGYGGPDLHEKHFQLFSIFTE
jgi:hypothetical protein